MEQKAKTVDNSEEMHHKDLKIREVQTRRALHPQYDAKDVISTNFTRNCFKILLSP